MCDKPFRGLVFFMRVYQKNGSQANFGEKLAIQYGEILSLMNSLF